MRCTRRLVVVLASVLFAAGPLVSPTPAPAAEDNTFLGTLSNSGGRIGWSRTIESGHTQVFFLDISLPADEWQRPGGVFVGVHYPGSQAALDATMSLKVVAPDGTESRSEGQSCCSDTQSLRLPSPGNGTYRIEVSSDNTVSYEGLAMVQHDKPTPLRNLLPDLTMLVPDRVQFAQFTLGTCTSVEQDQMAKRCLRFDLATANFGEGPLDIRIGDVHPSGRARALQRIDRSDGSFSERDAGTLSFHAEHGHLHFDDFWQAQLWASDPAGNRVGAQPVRAANKSALMCDNLNPWFGRRHTAPRRYSCDTPIRPLPPEFGGISVGWVEVYPLDVEGNYIEVSGVPDGSYVLRLITDPADKLLELDETNNAICQPITMGPGDTATKTGAAYGC